MLLRPRLRVIRGDRVRAVRKQGIVSSLLPLTGFFGRFLSVNQHISSSLQMNTGKERLTLWRDSRKEDPS